MNRYPIDKLSEGRDARGLDGLTVDRNAEVPIGVQLAWVLRARIRAGELLAGERLPGLRELAEAAGVNVNTARAVYQRLEQEGLIDSQQGSGTFVAVGCRHPSAAGEIAADAAREARVAGIDPREVGAALYVVGEPTAEPEDRAAQRRLMLRTQIAALERTLSEMEASHPGVAPTPIRSGAGPGPTILGAEQLERVRTQLVRRLVEVQAAIDAHVLDVADERRATASHAGARSRVRPKPATRPGKPAKPNKPVKPSKRDKPSGAAASKQAPRPGPTRPAPGVA